MKFNRWFVSELEFAPDFRYISGKFNTIADSLPRSQEDTEKFITTKTFCVLLPGGGFRFRNGLVRARER